MVDQTAKTAVVFRPKRQWRPKRRDRNITRRKKRKRWWRRNKHRLKIKRRQRRRRLKNNALFKQWRRKRQRERHKRRMRFAAEGEPRLPESWFIFRDEAVPLDIDLGYIVDYDPDTEQLLIHDVDEGQDKTVDLDEFLSHSEFLEEADLDNFELMMDQFYGGPEDDLDIVEEHEEAPIQVDAIIERVARRYLLRAARRNVS